MAFEPDRLSGDLPIGKCESEIGQLGRQLVVGIMLVVVMFGAALLAIGLLPFTVLPNPPLARKILRFALRILGRILYWSGIVTVKTESSCSECDHPLTPPVPNPAIFIANHVSLLDAVLLLPYLPDSVCVHKGSLLTHGPWSPIIKACGFISNGQQGTFEQSCIEQLGLGVSVLIFPEGTRRSEAGQGWSFKRGFAIVAHRANVPVVPIFLRWDRIPFREGEGLTDLPGKPCTMTLKFGDEVVVSADVLTEAAPNRWIAARRMTDEIERLFAARLS